MSIHNGHRQRLKNRFKKEGLENFEDLQVLELLLFHCVPRRDTNPIAHALLDYFGSFHKVMEATPRELKKVPDVGEGIANFLSLIMAVSRYYEVDKRSVEKYLNTIEDCGEYMIPYFKGLRNETVFLLCLDSKCKATCCVKVGEGSVNSASVPIRRIVEIALEKNATSVVLAHNHPSGLAIPSDEDKQTTLRLSRALSAVEVTLVDHLVVADGDYVSLAQSGFYDPDDCRVLL